MDFFALKNLRLAKAYLDIIYHIITTKTLATGDY